MSKKENIEEALKKIYHNKLSVYLDNPEVLHEIKINNNSVAVTFYELPGSIEINQLKPK